MISCQIVSIVKTISVKGKSNEFRDTILLAWLIQNPILDYSGMEICMGFSQTSITVISLTKSLITVKEVVKPSLCSLFFQWDAWHTSLVWCQQSLDPSVFEKPGTVMTVWDGKSNEGHLLCLWAWSDSLDNDEW